MHVLFYNCQSAFTFIISLDCYNNPVTYTEKILGHFFPSDLVLRGAVTALWLHYKPQYSVLGGWTEWAGSQTNLNRLFCLTPGQKARSGGRDGKGQDPWELLMLRHLDSSPSNALPLIFSTGLLAPHQKLLAHMLQTAAPHLPIAAECCASSVELLDSCELTSVTHSSHGGTLAATGLQCPLGPGTGHLRSRHTFPRSPLWLCNHFVFTLSVWCGLQSDFLFQVQKADSGAWMTEFKSKLQYL